MCPAYGRTHKKELSRKEWNHILPFHQRCRVRHRGSPQKLQFEGPILTQSRTPTEDLHKSFKLKANQVSQALSNTVTLKQR